jgi:rhomboid protease GluP
VTAGWTPAVADPKAAFAEFKLRLKAITPRIYAVPILVVLNVAVFVAMVATGVSAFDPGAPAALKWGADFGMYTLGGQPWRMLTSTFVHFGAIHILANMVTLAGSGPIIERLFGPVPFAAIYLVSGLTGSLTSVVVQPAVVSAGRRARCSGSSGRSARWCCSGAARSRGWS